MKRVYSVFSFLLLISLAYGQYDPKENFYDAEFFLAEEDYAEALYAFTQVYKDGFQDNANINYRIGVCLINLDSKKAEAIPYLIKASENITLKYKEGSFKEESAPPEVFYYLGNAYRIDNQFDKAINSYEKYLSYQSDRDESLYVKLQIEACKSAREAVKTKNDVRIGTLGQVNLIKAPVYNAVVSGDLTTLAFMGRQKFYNGVYVSRKQNGKWLKPYNITPSIQSDGNQTVLALSHDGNKMLLSWADQFESDIWITEYKNDRWYPSEPVGRPINSKFYESHACFSPDGKAIYFTSNRKESLGDMDIFKCEMNEDGSWGELILLGENVNTPLNEENPFISPDGDRIYFSSQGHPGYGGFDVFYCDINEDGSFGKAVHLDYPLNTSDDDFAFSPADLSYDNYLTIYAKGDQNQVDLFRFEWIPETAQPVVLAFEEADMKETDLEAKAEETETEIEDPVQEKPATELAGENTQEKPEEQNKVVDPQILEGNVHTDAIKPIFFSFDSYELSETAQQKLKTLADIMTRFPNVHLEVIGHTDNVGNMAYNELLAQKRAKTVTDFLISKGVDEKRLNAISKGETEPVALNRTPDDRDAPKGRALNRRVHFSASVPEGVSIEVEEVEVPDNLKIK